MTQLPRTSHRAVSAGLVVAAVGVAIGGLGFAGPARGVELVSVRAGSTLAAGGREAAISANGRYVAFHSRDGNVVPGDRASGDEVFLRDRVAGTTERVSVALDGGEANCDSFGASISDDGRYVAYMSCATNLVPGQPDVWGWHTFVRDRVAGTTEIAAVGIYPRISGNGRYVTFEAAPVDRTNDACGIDCPDVYVLDRTTRIIEPISVVGGHSANDVSHAPDISRDGRYVVYWSAATDLVAGDTNGAIDIFLHDRQTGLTERVSLGGDGQQANGPSIGRAALSADGRYVAFVTNASNLVPGDRPYVNDVLVRDRWTGTTERISVTTLEAPQAVYHSTTSISADGRFVTFEAYDGDANSHLDVFVRDRYAGTTIRASAGANRPCQRAAISADGRYVAFDTWAANLVAEDTNITTDVYLYDRGAQTQAPYTVTPSALDFQMQAVGTSTTKRFLLTNRSGAPLPISSIALRGEARGQFRLAHTCGSVVPTAGECAIRVSFVPTSLGDKQASVRVVAGANVVRTRPVRGVAVAMTGP